MKQLFTIGNRGDTIVEVLLAIAIVGAVLGGAFASTSKSLGGTQLSQDRAEALTIVQGQVEGLKILLDDDSATVPTADPFCVVEPNPGDPLEAVTVTPGTGCTLGTDNRFRVHIERVGDTYDAIAEWDSNSTEEQIVTIVYRAYTP